MQITLLFAQILKYLSLALQLAGRASNQPKASVFNELGKRLNNQLAPLRIYILGTK